MILDSSAVLAIIFREPGFEEVLDRLARAPSAAIGTPTISEAGIVLSWRLGREAPGLIDRFLQEFQITQIPFGEDHWRAALAAYERFGKGRHPAGLNFGDCLTYAIAHLAAQPLLFVGDDFSKTDLRAA